MASVVYCWPQSNTTYMEQVAEPQIDILYNTFRFSCMLQVRHMTEGVHLTPGLTLYLLQVNQHVELWWNERRWHLLQMTSYHWRCTTELESGLICPCHTWSFISCRCKLKKFRAVWCLCLCSTGGNHGNQVSVSRSSPGWPLRQMSRACTLSCGIIFLLYNNPSIGFIKIHKTC